MKRVYRVMGDHSHLLEPRIKQPGTPSCSDRYEFRYEDGAKLSETFTLDRCDREAIGWVASPTG